MRFVPVKSADARAALLDHVAPEVRLRRNARDFLIRQQTRTVNTIRAHLAEFGVVVPKGIHNVDRLLEAAEHAPEAARPAIDLLADQLRDLRGRIETVTKRIEAARKADPLARRLATIPGLGPIASSAVTPQACLRHDAVTTPDVAAFRSARDCSAWRGVQSVSRTDRVPARTAEAALERRQGAPRADLKGREQVPATAPLPGSHGEPSRRHAFESCQRSRHRSERPLATANDRGAPPRTTRGRLAVEHAAEKAREGGRHRPGQSHGAGGLGVRHRS
jgi:transposase